MKLHRPSIWPLVLTLFFLVTDAFGAVHVGGYTRKDGTYVAPHNRSSPNHTKADNWSTKGNVNPYTGKEGTKNFSPSSTAPIPLSRESTPTAKDLEKLPKVEPSPKSTTLSPEVLEWHQKQANEGLSSSQYELGRRYLLGDGLTKDDPLGRAWLSKAATQRHTQAFQLLKNTDFENELKDAKGRITRSTTARKAFMTQSGYPNGRAGYVVQHIQPIEEGGSDTPENLQWVETEKAMDQDRKHLQQVVK